MFGYPPHSDRSNTPDYYQTHCTVNNRGVLQGLALPNAQLPGRIGEDPFRKCLTQNCLRIPYRLTYTAPLLHFCNCWLFGYIRHVLTQRSEEHTSELQSRPHLVCRLLLEK